MPTPRRNWRILGLAGCVLLAGGCARPAAVLRGSRLAAASAPSGRGTAAAAGTAGARGTHPAAGSSGATSPLAPTAPTSYAADPGLRHLAATLPFPLLLPGGIPGDPFVEEFHGPPPAPASPGAPRVARATIYFATATAGRTCTLVEGNGPFTPSRGLPGETAVVIRHSPRVAGLLYPSATGPGGTAMAQTLEFQEQGVWVRLQSTLGAKALLQIARGLRAG